MDSVEVKFLTKPIPAPGASNVRYVGGRMKYYGALEIVEPGEGAGTGGAVAGAAAAILLPNVSIITPNDIVEVAAVNQSNQPFLAQMEACWEDSFTGIAYCRARWLVRASEVPTDEDVSKDEVLITPVTNDIKAINILGRAPVALPPVDATSAAACSSEVEVKSEAAAAAVVGAPRALRSPRSRSTPKQGEEHSSGKRSKNTTLYLSRSYDPFTAELGVLSADHPAVVQLRKREQAESAYGGGGGGSGREKTRGLLSNGNVSTRRKSSGGSGRYGVEREGLRDAKLSVLAEGKTASAKRSRSATSSDELSGGGDSSSSSSASVSMGDNSDDNITTTTTTTTTTNSTSNGGFTSEDSRDGVLDDDALGDHGDVNMARANDPKRRRKRQNQAGAETSTAVAASATAVTPPPPSIKVEPVAATDPGVPNRLAPSELSLSLSEPTTTTAIAQRPTSRPRRLAMPPDNSDTFDPTGGDGVGAKLAVEAHAQGAVSSAAGRKSLLRGGPLIRMAHAGDDSEDCLDSPKVEQYPQKETNVGEDHQVDITPILLTESERAADRKAVETGGMGGTLVWGSTRDWADEERERLDRYLDEARVKVNAKRMLPGVPALVSINNGGDRRRKRKMSWAVVTDGKPQAEDKIRFGCGGTDVVEVSRHEVRPIQAEELAMQALMQAGQGTGKKNGGLTDDTRPALDLLDDAEVDESGPLATWTGPQVASLSEALENHFDHDRYSRSRGHDRHRDEHTDITSLIMSVDGKTPSQVLSFYYRYMATGDALTDIMASFEAQARLRAERKATTRPRTPPHPRPNPAPNLRHRPSLRCPSRLAPSPEGLDSGDSGSSSNQRTRRSSKNERRAVAVAATVAAAGAAKPSSGDDSNDKGSSGGRTAGNNEDSGGGRASGKPECSTRRQCVDRRRVALPEQQEESAAFPGGEEGGESTATAAAPCRSRADAFGRSRTPSVEQQQETCGRNGDRSVAWVQEKRASAASEGDKRGCKRPLEKEPGCVDDRKRVDEGREIEQMAQRPRWQESNRPAIPADAVIVEVSDDEEPAPAAAASGGGDGGGSSHYLVDRTGRVSNGRGVYNLDAPTCVGRPIAAEIADSAFKSPMRAGGSPRGAHRGLQLHQGATSSVYPGRSSDRGDHRFVDNSNTVTPAEYQYPHDRRRYSDRTYTDYGKESQQQRHPHHYQQQHHMTSNVDDEQNLHRYHHHHQNNGGSGYGHGYGGGGIDSSGGRRYITERHSHAAAAASSGGAAGGVVSMRNVSMREWKQHQQHQQQPGVVYETQDWRSVGVRDWGGARGGDSVGCSSTDGYRRRDEEPSPIEQCWLLVDYAEKDGLPMDRVEYLRGLFRTHEKKTMTQRMLAERTESCLYDRQDIQKAFLGIFAHMGAQESRRTGYGGRHDVVPSHAGVTYTSSGVGSSVNYMLSSGASNSAGSGQGRYGHDSSGYSYNNKNNSHNHNGGVGRVGESPSSVSHQHRHSLSSSFSSSSSSGLACPGNVGRGGPRQDSEGLGRMAAAAAAAAVTASTSMMISGGPGVGVGGGGDHGTTREGRSLHHQVYRGVGGGGEGGMGLPLPPMALASDMRRLGEGTSMRRPLCRGSSAAEVAAAALPTLAAVATAAVVGGTYCSGKNPGL